MYVRSVHVHPTPAIRASVLAVALRQSNATRTFVVNFLFVIVSVCMTVPSLLSPRRLSRCLHILNMHAQCAH